MTFELTTRLGPHIRRDAHLEVLSWEGLQRDFWVHIVAVRGGPYLYAALELGDETRFVDLTVREFTCEEEIVEQLFEKEGEDKDHNLHPFTDACPAECRPGRHPCTEDSEEED